MRKKNKSSNNYNLENNNIDLKQKIKNIEVDNIELKTQLKIKDELDKKMIEELNYIRKKENFNYKIKMEQIDNEIKEKAKNEFEEELNKELIIKEKEIKIKYNQKLENFKKKFRNELNEEYEKKKKEMKNQLNDIKYKIYRSRCSEKIKISKINKMKKKDTLLEFKIKQQEETIEKQKETISKLIGVKYIVQKWIIF